MGLLCYRLRKPTAGIGWVIRLTDWWRGKTAGIGFHGNLFFQELYKMLVTGRGAIVLLAALLICYSAAQSPYLGNDGGVVNQSLETYFRQSQGPVSEETDAFIEKQREKLEALQEEKELLEALPVVLDLALTFAAKEQTSVSASSVPILPIPSSPKACTSESPSLLARTSLTPPSTASRRVWNENTPIPTFISFIALAEIWSSPFIPFKPLNIKG